MALEQIPGKPGAVLKAYGRPRGVDHGTPVDQHRVELPQMLPGPQGAEALHRKRLPCDDKRQPQTHRGQA